MRAVAVIDDLLNAFMGLDGKYARARRVDQPDGAHIKYTLEARADPSLQELATRMLPIWCANSGSVMSIHPCRNVESLDASYTPTDLRPPHLLF